MLVSSHLYVCLKNIELMKIDGGLGHLIDCATFLQH